MVAHRPDILLALIDDMGYADVTPHATPNLAAYEQAPTACKLDLYLHPLCTPARAAFLTGRLCHRYALCDWLRDPPHETRALPVGEVLLPSLLKPLGCKPARL